MSRIMQEDLKNRAKGALWGLVIGDCLGSPIQFSEKDNHPFITEMVPCEIFRTPAGYWTDDASMAFCIIESYIRLKKYDLEDIASNFVKWYNSGFMSSMPYAFDVGGATDYAIQCIEKKSMKNGNEQTQGNGSIMRFAPSYFISNKEKEKNIIFDISDLTHYSSVVRNVVLKLSDTISEHLQGVRTSNKSRYSNREEVDNSGWAVSTMEAALWAFENSFDFESGMIKAVNLGGDSDTIGAVFGQIAGAYYGFSNIPERWVSSVKNYKKIDIFFDNFLESVL